MIDENIAFVRPASVYNIMKEYDLVHKWAKNEGEAKKKVLFSYTITFESNAEGTTVSTASIQDVADKTVTLTANGASIRLIANLKIYLKMKTFSIAFKTANSIAIQNKTIEWGQKINVEDPSTKWTRFKISMNKVTEMIPSLKYSCEIEIANVPSIGSGYDESIKNALSSLYSTKPELLIDLFLKMKGGKIIGGTSFMEEDAMIGDNAFENCLNLIEISLPSALSNIEDKAFKGCVSLSQIKNSFNGDYPEEGKIGYYAFCGCSKIQQDVMYLQKYTMKEKQQFSNLEFKEN